MMTETLHLIAPMLCASILAWMAYYLAKNLRIRPKILRYLEDFYASSGNTRLHTSQGDRIGSQIAERLPFSFDT
jgi:hypothetical protein